MFSKSRLQEGKSNGAFRLEAYIPAGLTCRARASSPANHSNSRVMHRRSIAAISKSWVRIFRRVCWLESSGRSVMQGLPLFLVAMTLGVVLTGRSVAGPPAPLNFAGSQALLGQNLYTTYCAA